MVDGNDNKVSYKHSTALQSTKTEKLAKKTNETYFVIYVRCNSASEFALEVWHPVTGLVCT